MQKTIYTPAYRALITQLHQARIQAGLRQQDVAERLGVNRTWVSKVEQGQVRLDLVQFVLLSRACGICARGLLEAMESMFPTTANAKQEDSVGAATTSNDDRSHAAGSTA